MIRDGRKKKNTRRRNKKCFKKFLDTYAPDELLEELKEYGLELSEEEQKHWIEPIVIDTEEDLELFIQALEKAAVAPKKDIVVDYKDVTDVSEIKEIFYNLKEG